MQKPNTPGGGTQFIAVNLLVSGDQHTRVDSHGVQGPGSYITVATPDVLLTVHDAKAVAAYAGAWTDAVGSAIYLPEHRPVLRRKVEKAARHPGIVIAAHGGDNVETVYVPHIRQLIIRIGYVTWAVVDGAAYESMAAAWITVSKLAEVIFPPRP